MHTANDKRSIGVTIVTIKTDIATIYVALEFLYQIVSHMILLIIDLEEWLSLSQ